MVARLWPSVVLVAALHGPLVLAAEGDELFERKIRPILVERCYSCHSAKVAAPMGGLRLDVPLQNEHSRKRLLLAISYTDPQLRMPPTGKLAQETIDDIRRWIEMGAPDPRANAVGPASAEAGSDNASVARARDYWAFQPVRKPVPPPGAAANPIDRFLDARIGEKKLKVSAPADRRSWLRRVSLDLTGLPPARADLDAYLADVSENADENAVERLLASPHYGERWARHWMDLVRFAETNGHEFDNNKLDAWQYRDYLIRAFNADLPYDQLVREHIAGDLLPNPRLASNGAFLESPIASGAFWFGEVLNSAVDSVKTRADTVDNQLDVAGKAFLGLTVACARCHDHKFDPIPTRDYYSMAGILHSTYLRETVVDSPSRVREIEQAMAKVAARNRDWTPAASGKAELRAGDELFEDFGSGSFVGSWQTAGQAFGQGPVRGYANSAGPGANQLVGSLTSRKFRMPKLWVHVRLAGTKPSAAIKESQSIRVTVVADDHKSAHLVPSGKPGFEWVSARMTKEIGRECYFEIVDRARDGHIVVDKIVISDEKEPPADPSAIASPVRLAEDGVPIPESVWAMTSQDENPHDIRLHIRGSHTNLGDEVPRGFFLEVITGAGQPLVKQGSGRLELADWFARGSNPLTARVMVNRVWKHHFGAGLVRTPDNFGKTGQRPSHPELLDWLAASFVESGWSVKQLHRWMVLSAAYRRSSKADPEAEAADPTNALLARYPVRRLEAEVIRDSMLAVAGTLAPRLFGPSVMPHISRYQDGRGKPKSGPLDGDGRRSIYVQVRRNFLTPMFLAFDYPLPVSTIGARGSSTVPSQALLMLNNEFVLQQAGAWADRASSREPDPARRLERMYVEAFARPPEDWERREALAYADRASWTDLAHALLNSAEFLYVQ
ncbi:MAG: PSD1 and planctomycete cytochrome C domain-containing protein [Bryobacteraceae bacterium]